jgi:hypothetical protein
MVDAALPALETAWLPNPDSSRTQLSSRKENHMTSIQILSLLVFAAVG